MITVQKMKLIDTVILRTLLNTSRQHEIRPKHSNITGSCEIIIIIGRIRLNSFLNRYHSDRSITSLISLNASLNRCPSSQEMKIKANELKASKINNNSATP